MRRHEHATPKDRLEVAQFARFLSLPSPRTGQVSFRWYAYAQGTGPAPPMAPGEPVRRGGIPEVRTWERADDA